MGLKDLITLKKSCGRLLAAGLAVSLAHCGSAASSAAATQFSAANLYTQAFTQFTAEDRQSVMSALGPYPLPQIQDLIRAFPAPSSVIIDGVPLAIPHAGSVQHSTLTLNQVWAKQGVTLRVLGAADFAQAMAASLQRAKEAKGPFVASADDLNLQANLLAGLVFGVLDSLPKTATSSAALGLADQFLWQWPLPMTPQQLRQRGAQRAIAAVESAKQKAACGDPLATTRGRVDAIYPDLSAPGRSSQVTTWRRKDDKLNYVMASIAQVPEGASPNDQMSGGYVTAMPVTQGGQLSTYTAMVSPNHCAENPDICFYCQIGVPMGSTDSSAAQQEALGAMAAVSDMLNGGE